MAPRGLQLACSNLTDLASLTGRSLNGIPIDRKKAVRIIHNYLAARIQEETTIRRDCANLLGLRLHSQGSEENHNDSRLPLDQLVAWDIVEESKKIRQRKLRLAARTRAAVGAVGPDSGGPLFSEPAGDREGADDVGRRTGRIHLV